MDIDTMITTYNGAVADAVSEILKKVIEKKALGHHRCDKEGDLKKMRHEAEAPKEQRENNKRIQKAVKKAR